MSILPVNDLNAYLLYFLDTKSILTLSAVSKEQQQVLLSIKLYTDIRFISMKESFLAFRTDIVTISSKYGSISLLEWFTNSGYEFKYTYAINVASENGHLSVLEWFKNSGYEFKYTSNAINVASENGHLSVLEWFKNSGYEFKYTYY